MAKVEFSFKPTAAMVTGYARKLDEGGITFPDTRVRAMLFKGIAPPPLTYHRDGLD